MTPTLTPNLDPDIWRFRKREARAAQPMPTLRGGDWAKGQASELHKGRGSYFEWYIQCHLHGMQSLSAVVDVDPDVRGGVPVIAGTRFTVAQVFAELAETSGVEEVAYEFSLDVLKIRMLLNGFSLVLQKPTSLK